MNKFLIITDGNSIEMTSYEVYATFGRDPIPYVESGTPIILNDKEYYIDYAL